MVTHTSAWKLVLVFVVVMIGAAIGIPLARYSERDDAPGGVVIAVVIMLGAVVLAIRIVTQRPQSSVRK